MQKQTYETILKKCNNQAQCIIVSKYRSVEEIQSYYQLGQRLFGENKVQEVVSKHKELPQDIAWHFIGHLQTNKVKYIAPLVSLIHSVDSLRLAKEINRQAKKQDRVISILLQFNLAKEETKSGFAYEEHLDILEQIDSLPHIRIEGIMVMGPHTQDTNAIASIFQQAQELLQAMQKHCPTCKQLSMGMSQDYEIALQYGTTYVRIGSILF